MRRRVLTPKEKETNAAHEFVRRQGLTCEVVRREAPDFELRFADGSVVGLELTGLTHQQAAKDRRTAMRFSKAITERLCAIGRESHVGPRFVGSDLASLAQRGQIDRHADAIVSLVVRHHDSGEPYRKYDRDFLRCSGMPHLDAVFIGPGLAVVTVETATGHLAPFVQSSIDAKNAKLASYRAALPGCKIWLLLVTDFARIAVWSVVVGEHVYRSDFDRTFSFDPLKTVRPATELKTVAPALPHGLRGVSG